MAKLYYRVELYTDGFVRLSDDTGRPADREKLEVVAGTLHRLADAILTGEALQMPDNIASLDG